MLHHDDSHQDGFTLIELLTVVIVIGILAAIAIPNFLDQREHAYGASAQAAVRSAVLDVEGYFADNQAYPADGADLVALGAQGAEGVTLSFALVGNGYRIDADHDMLDGDDDGDPADGDVDAFYASAVGRVQTP